MFSYVLMLQADIDDKDIAESMYKELNMSFPVKYLEDIHQLDALASESGKPTLILLNENSAKDKGTQIVKKLKSNPSYSHIPIVVLGETSPASYVTEYYKAGANTFIVKPSTVELTKKKVDIFFKYWMEVAEV